MEIRLNFDGDDVDELCESIGRFDHYSSLFHFRSNIDIDVCYRREPCNSKETRRDKILSISFMVEIKEIHKVDRFVGALSRQLLSVVKDELTRHINGGDFVSTIRTAAPNKATISFKEIQK